MQVSEELKLFYNKVQPFEGCEMRIMREDGEDDRNGRINFFCGKSACVGVEVDSVPSEDDIEFAKIDVRRECPQLNNQKAS